MAMPFGGLDCIPGDLEPLRSGPCTPAQRHVCCSLELFCTFPSHSQHRYNYVTPTSYLELLGTFIRLLGEKRNEINEGRRRLEVGLQKLLSTAAEVEVMQKELQDLQPILAKTSQEVEDMMVVITNDKREADETKRMVEQQEKEANVQAAKAKEIADDAQVGRSGSGG